MIIVLTIAVFALSAIACHFIAKNRGANPVFWGVTGAIFGPIAIPFAFLSKPSYFGGFSNPENKRM